MSKNKYLLRFEDKDGIFLASVYFCNMQSPKSNYIKAIASSIGRTAPAQKNVVNALLSVLPQSAGIMVEDKWYVKYPKNKTKVESIADANDWRVGSDESAGLIIVSAPITNYIERTPSLEILTYRLLPDADEPRLVETRKVTYAR